jgi:hypothetical protein
MNEKMRSHIFSWKIKALRDLMPLAFLVEQMGNVWFCCWDANRVCNGLRLCWSSKDSSVQFRDNRSGITSRLISEPWIPFDLCNCLLRPQRHLYVLISVISVAYTLFCNSFGDLYYLGFNGQHPFLYIMKKRLFQRQSFASGVLSLHNVHNQIPPAHPIIDEIG